ncbi:MAG: hypothetical protein JSR20_06145 [Nitrospira sp.]|nr:hypothetical protein [Nitrospira sp.]
MVWTDLASSRYTKCKTCVATIHGLAGTDEYQSAYDAVSRCEDKRDQHYAIYGAIGRTCEFPGDTIAEKAAAMAEYLVENVGRRPSRDYVLDRIDNNGNYAPGNLQWVSIPTSLRNRSVNRRIELNGVILCLCDWVKITGIHRGTIATRLKQGQTPAQALTRPVRRRKQREAA